MKKLNLNVDDLQVESFETMARGRAGRGTVLGQYVQVTLVCADTPMCVDTDDCPPPTGLDCTNDTSWQQCGYSYGGTCGASPPYSYQNDCGGLDAARAGFSPPQCG